MRRRKKLIAALPAEQACKNNPGKAALRLRILDAEIAAIVRQIVRGKSEFEYLDNLHRDLCNKRQRARSLAGYVL